MSFSELRNVWSLLHHDPVNSDCMLQDTSELMLMDSLVGYILSVLVDRCFLSLVKHHQTVPSLKIF